MLVWTFLREQLSPRVDEPDQEEGAYLPEPLALPWSPPLSLQEPSLVLVVLCGASRMNVAHTASPLFSRACPDQMLSRRDLSRCPWMCGLYLGFLKL